VEEIAGRQGQAFLDHLRHQRRLSPRTVESYERDLRSLTDFCDSQGYPAWAALRPAAIRSFMAQGYKRSHSAKTLQRQLAAIRSFYRYLLREGLATANPALGIRPPKSPRRLPKVLDPDQAGRLVTVATAGSDPLDARDRALLELMYSSGLRLAETVGLNLADMDLNDATIRVTGKGSKTRVLPMGRHALEALRVYLPLRLTVVTTANEPALFVSQRGGRLTGRAVQYLVRRRALSQEVGQPVNPHMLRHSCASHLLESSGDLRAVQELLGHADLSSTQIYTHLDYQHLAQVYDRAHPRARRRR
jgi:integrase/recombinase XerC